MPKNSTPQDLAQYVFEEIRRSKIKDEKPSYEVLKELFETLYFTSLQTEEGQFIKVVITFIDPTSIKKATYEDQYDNWKFYPFDSKMEFTIKNLVKLSKAADPWSSSLAVYHDKDGKLFILGMIDQTVHYQSFLNYEREERPDHPGVIQVMVTGIGILNVMLDYQPRAALNQNSFVKFYPNVFEYGPISEFLRKHCRYSHRSIEQIIGDKLDTREGEEFNKLIYENVIQAVSRILLRIKNYNHGGAILITKEFVEGVKIKYKLKYDRIASGIKHVIA